jgi:hypothetical protein
VPKKPACVFAIGLGEGDAGLGDGKAVGCCVGEGDGFGDGDELAYGLEERAPKFGIETGFISG